MDQSSFAYHASGNVHETGGAPILRPAISRLLSQFPDVKVEIHIDYGLTDIVAERYDAGVRLGEQVAKA
jgi:DNA-binding transcriptional LysR family regulator